MPDVTSVGPWLPASASAGTRSPATGLAGAWSLDDKEESLSERPVSRRSGRIHGNSSPVFDLRAEFARF